MCEEATEVRALKMAAFDLMFGDAPEWLREAKLAQLEDQLGIEDDEPLPLDASAT